MLFGITSSVCSLFIRYGRRLVLQGLSRDVNDAVRLHCDTEIVDYKASISSTHSMLTDVYEVANGLKIYLEQSGDTIIKNMF